MRQPGSQFNVYPEPLTGKNDLFFLPETNEVFRVYLPGERLGEYQLDGIDGLDPELFTTPDGVKQLVETALTHYGKLRELGADVPKLTYNLSDSSQTVFLTTEFIPSRPVSRRNFPTQLTKERMIKPLIRYYEWLYDTAQPLGLFDVVGLPYLDNYSGEQFSVSNDAERLFLHDTPPRVLPVLSRYFIRETGREAEQLGKYIDALEPRIPPEEHRQLSADWLRALNKIENFIHREPLP